MFQNVVYKQGTLKQLFILTKSIYDINTNMHAQIAQFCLPEGMDWLRAFDQTRGTVTLEFEIIQSVIHNNCVPHLIGVELATISTCFGIAFHYVLLSYQKNIALLPRRTYGMMMKKIIYNQLRSCLLAVLF